jgi:hypothetical protein
VNGIEENHAAADGAALMFDKENYEDLQRRWQQLVDDRNWSKNGPRRAAATPLKITAGMRSQKITCRFSAK